MKPYIPIIIVCILVMSGFGVASTTNNLAIMDNHPPFDPSNYYPCGEYDDVDIDVNLSWDGGDPDLDDTVTYDVYFGTEPGPEWVATIGPYPANQTQIYYEPGILEYCKIYYMKIAASDNHGASAEGYTCFFKTICPLYPPEIYGPTNGKVGVKYDYNFVQYNPECDEISYFIDWGDNTTTGYTDYYSAGEEITRNHTWCEEGGYKIKAKVKDFYERESSWSYFEVTMPKSHNPIWWLYGLLDRFPLLQRLLWWLIL